MKKNIENSDAPTRSPTMLAPVRVRMRKIRNGTSGACERRSIAMKAAISAADRPIRPSVRNEPQPALVASTIAYTRIERPAVTVTAPAASKWRGGGSVWGLGEKGGGGGADDARPTPASPTYPPPP